MKLLFPIQLLTVCLFLIFLPFQVWEAIPLSSQNGKILFACWVAPFFYLLFILNQIFYKDKIIRLKQIDVCLLIAGLYLVLHILFIKPVNLHPFFIAEGFALIGLYLLVRTIPHSGFIVVFVALMLAAFGQAVWGLLQHYQLLPSLHQEFDITGTFFNPAPYSGYIAMTIPIIAVMIVVFSFVGSRNDLGFFHRGWRLPLLYLTAVTAIICILMLVLAQSRAAWLAAGGSVLFVWFSLPEITRQTMIRNIFPLSGRINWKIDQKIKCFVSIGILILIVILLGYKAYLHRTDSVIGRLLIWKSTFCMIQTQPLTGVGTSQFPANYMHYQAEYLSQHTNPKVALLADNTIYAFNELLKITAEFGIPGFLIFIALIISVFGRGKNNDLFLIAARSGLVSFLLFACFSYPFAVLPLKVLFTVYLAVVAFSQHVIFVRFGPYKFTKHLSVKILKVISVILIPVLLFFTFYQVRRQNLAFQMWKSAVDNYNDGNIVECIDKCETIYPLLKTDGFFMSMYGGFLSGSKRYDKAEKIFTEAAILLPTNNVYLSLGNCYLQRKDFKEAEETFLYAHQLVPCRARPVLALAQLYQYTGQTKRAIEVINSHFKILERKKTVATYEIELCLKRLHKSLYSDNIILSEKSSAPKLLE